jgi:hypothetical protein
MSSHSDSFVCSGSSPTGPDFISENHSSVMAGSFLMSLRRCHRLRPLAPRRQRARADKIPDSQLVISPSMLFAPKILAARRGKKERGAR